MGFSTSGFRVQDLGFRALGLAGFRVQDLGFRTYGLGLTYLLGR